MKQYNLSTLTSQAEAALVSYLASSLPVGNHQNQSKLGERFLALWNEHTFKGPYIETLPQYEKTSSLSELAASSVSANGKDGAFFCKMRPSYNWSRIDSDPTLRKFLRARRQLWPDDCADGVNEVEKTTLERLWDRKLYSHQRQAFETVSKSRSNAIVATATGSGKTECFLIPLLYELLTEPNDTRLRSGVRAILLYPMNALVEDQMARLRRLLFWINLRAFDGSPRDSRLVRAITFGRYTGETQVNEGDNGPDRSVSQEEVHELGELRYRQEMQQTPPDILVTNFTMLEYMLLRNDDRRLFREPDLFKFLILDEVHSYRGTTGMEVATLLSRFRNYLTRNSSAKMVSYFCIGTSATLSSEADAPDKMAKFASRLFGAPFSTNNVITGDIRPSGLAASNKVDSGQFLERLLQLPSSVPKLCRAFGIEGLYDDSADDSDIPDDEWKILASLLGADAVLVGDLLNEQMERTDLLGRLVLACPLFAEFKTAFTARNGIPITLNDLVRTLWGESSGARRADCCTAAGRFIQLMQAARSKGEGLLPLRAHVFVREHRSAYLCVDPTHATKDTRSTDGWWSELFVSHRNSCDICGSLVYPLWLCRKCGFVVLEGWIRTKSRRVCPERDDLMGRDQFKRILFRPLNGLTVRTRDRLQLDNKPVVSICTHCGLRFPPRP